MTEDQRKRFDELLLAEAQKRGVLTVVDIMMLKEAFFSVEIERPTYNVHTSISKETKNDNGVCET